jgi:hypothetical protein
MSKPTRQRVITKAEQLGYTIVEDYCDVRLEAPKGYCFDQDHHEVVSEYGGMTAYTKAEAWEDLYDHIGTAEPCEIEQCDWCGGEE